MINDEPGGASDPAPIRQAEELFRSALLRTHRDRQAIGELESAAAQFCRVMRRAGVTPEETLKDAKRVIHDAIDEENVRVAERAVQVCIQHYFRTD